MYFIFNITAVKQTVENVSLCLMSNIHNHSQKFFQIYDL